MFVDKFFRMKLPRILLLMLLSIGLWSFSTTPLRQDCDRIEVQVELIHTSNGGDNGTAHIKLTKGTRVNLKYIFCEQSGRVLNEKKFEQSSIDNLPPGEYFCIVNNDDCTKQIRFTIK